MISCANHDYIEIACLYHYRIELTLLDGTTTRGRAQTTQTRAGKKEFLVLKGGGGEHYIDMDSIKSMQALSANPHFDKISFL